MYAYFMYIYIYMYISNLMFQVFLLPLWQNKALVFTLIYKSIRN